MFLSPDLVSSIVSWEFTPSGILLNLGAHLTEYIGPIQPVRLCRNAGLFTRFNLPLSGPLPILGPVFPILHSWPLSLALARPAKAATRSDWVSCGGQKTDRNQLQACLPLVERKREKLSTWRIHDPDS